MVKKNKDLLIFKDKVNHYYLVMR